MMSNGFYCMYCLWIAVLLQSAYIVAPEECEEPTTGEPLRYLAAGLRSLQNRHIEEAAFDLLPKPNRIYAPGQQLTRARQSELQHFWTALHSLSEMQEYQSTLNSLNDSGENLPTVTRVLQAVMNQVIEDACQWLKATMNYDESFNCPATLKRFKAMLKVWQGATVMYRDVRALCSGRECSIPCTETWLKKTVMQLSPDDRETVEMALETASKFLV